MNDINFHSMGLKDELLRMIAAKGYDTPTPIQVKAIPLALTGRDLMGKAQTGSGKTAAFGLPVLNQIIPRQGLQALILCPTRELALQVADEISALGKLLPVFCLPVYGGQSIELQFRSLRRNPEIVVATPGRLLDHLTRKTIDLSLIKFVVLDEADEMLDMGFIPDVENILSQCPAERNTYLFSATLFSEIKNLGSKFMKDPLVVEVDTPELTVPSVEQYYYRTNPRQKVETICRLIDVSQPRVSLIFCRTKKGAHTLASTLNRRGYPAQALHGDMSQRERDYVMENFRSGQVQILVATDLAARGLDIDIITHVFNFDIPDDPDVYVHRIGRTARAGREGIAITLVEGRQIRQLKQIEQHTGKLIQAQKLPSLQDALQKRDDDLIAQVLASVSGEMSNYSILTARLLEEAPAEKIIGALLKLLSGFAPKLETAELENNERSPLQLEIPLGRRQNVNPRRLVDFIVANTRLKPRQVGDIDIQNHSSLVEIPAYAADEVYALFDSAGKKKWHQQHSRSTKRLPPAHRSTSRRKG